MGPRKSVNGVPVKLVVVPLLFLLAFVAFFFSEGSAPEELRAPRRPGGGDGVQPPDVSQKLHELADENAKLAAELKALKAKPQQPQKGAGGRVAEAQQRDVVDRNARVYDDGTRRCVYLGETSVDANFMGYYYETSQELNGAPVFVRPGGAWLMLTNYIARLPDGRWCLSSGSDKALRGVCGKRSKEPADFPGDVRLWEYSTGPKAFHDNAGFKGVTLEGDECRSKPVLDNAIDTNFEPKPVKGVHYDATYDVENPHTEPEKYAYPSGKRALTYPEDLPAERKLPHVLLSHVPKVYWFEKMATDEECDAIIDLAHDKIHRSTVVLQGKEHGNGVKDVRTSSHTWLDPSHEPVRRLINRLLATTGFGVADHESLQVLRYNLFQKYDAHNDYLDPRIHGKQSTNRAVTCFIYLHDVEEGGATWFPRANKGPHPRNYTACDSGLSAKPRKGTTACFYDMRPDFSFDEYSLHAGCPVVKGTKWGGTLWLHTLT